MEIIILLINNSIEEDIVTPIIAKQLNFKKVVL